MGCVPGYFFGNCSFVLFVPFALPRSAICFFELRTTQSKCFVKRVLTDPDEGADVFASVSERQRRRGVVRCGADAGLGARLSVDAAVRTHDRVLHRDHCSF